MLGSKAPMLGAAFNGCAGCVNSAEGVPLGGGTTSGKPLLMRLNIPEAGMAQPAPTVTESGVVAVVPLVPTAEATVLVQASMKPGILPAMAVTWNVESVSKNNP